ncbi:class I adenylate-forming enzyme family protein [Sphingobium subterraneum]|uniref:Long-chain acyl-CoA synthetase n=1 Tax=Sphingobium subterraneum TaxID=627688 RepID=A0A841J4N5_9SPHN|nr:AMP-binding protein [Sphingobium subterraneum]MBB6125302.1 long-chain acyl-CoA synthetase [Sphingobium subterraneum]
MQLTQGLRRSARLYGERPATIFGERTTSWSELAQQVAPLAGALRAKGAKKGDRIAILALNSDRYILAYYAIAWAGCVAVPFNTRWAPAELDEAIRDSLPSIIIVDRVFAEQGRMLAATGMTVIGLEDDLEFPSVTSLLGTHEAIEDACGHGDDLAAIFYTGGTTGQSKGVMLSHTNLLTNFLLVNAAEPYGTNAVFLHIPPMFHLADAFHIFGMSLIGATHAVLPSFDPDAAIDAMETYNVTALVLVPTMIGMICEKLRERKTNLAGIRRLTYGASPISDTLLKQALAAFPNATLCQSYGQTELSPCVTVLDHADHMKGLLRSAGRQLPGVDLKIADADGMELEAGQVGEIVARGPCVMKGYWGKPELTSEVLVNGWIRTGDAGYLDANGYLFLVDRVKDMIVSGGENIYSVEVENAIMRHENVVQCAVIGVPDPVWGEKVHAIVQLREGSVLTDAELVSHCAPLIANYKRPKSCEFRYTSLPLSPVGKILKTELRKPFWEGHSRSIG